MTKHPCANLFVGTLQVANEIWERLGNIGWSVVELIHSENERTPCDLVAEIASADVLLTTHGFQVRFVLGYNRDAE